MQRKIARLVVRLPSELHKRLVRSAAHAGLSLNKETLARLGYSFMRDSPDELEWYRACETIADAAIKLKRRK